MLGSDVPDYIGFADFGEMLNLGSACGLPRDEVLTWKHGSAPYVSLHGDSYRELFHERGMNPTVRHTDVSPLEQPFPLGRDIRVDALNGSFYSGSLTRWSSATKRTSAMSVTWPSRLLMAESVAYGRGLRINESEPGRAARFAIAEMDSLGELALLAHEPLLSLLEKMAARQGLGFYKERLRGLGKEAHPLDVVGPTEDSLPEVSFAEIKLRRRLS